MRIAALIFVLIFSVKSTFCQTRLENNKNFNRSFLPSSPSTASLGVFGDVPVSLFTGTPQIEIPLYQFNFKDLGVDLKLKYHQAIANKPDAFPGLTGNGWLLNMGGVITRTSRGMTSYNFPSGTLIPTNFNPTESATWNSNTTMQGFLTSQTAFFNDYGRYDEFSYNFGNNSGSFFTNFDESMKIQSAEGEDLLIEKTVMASKNFTLPTETQQPLTMLGQGSQSVVYTNIMPQANFIYKFVITDSKGIKYTFGGTDNSIEFTRPGMKVDQFEYPNEQNTTPSSWYLTSIQSPNGYGITLTYTRGKFYITSETYVTGKTILPGSWAATAGNTPTAKLIKSTMYHPCYLDQIITPISSVKFNWSVASGQLGYTFVPENPPFQANSTWLAPDPYSEFYFVRYAQVKEAAITNRFPNKLDNFVVTDDVSRQGAAIVKKVVEFAYTNLTTTRLKLTSVKIKSSPQSTVFSQYSFQYNTTALPEYLSYKTDAYGYYNGTNPYITSDVPSYYTNLFANATSRQNYINSRAPNATYSQAEILKRITYPTGGYTEFEFENHYYGTVASFWPAATTPNAGGTPIMSAGLRIRKIKKYDFEGNLAGEKNYYYKKDYATAGTASSGVLSYSPSFYRYFNGAVTCPAKWVGTASAPTYSGTMTLTQFGTSPLNTPNNNSSFITYSEVAEVNSDGSYTVMKFKNYDNGYHDKPAENSVCDNSNIDGGFFKEDQMNSLDLERGQILTESIYNAANTVKKTTTYTYNDDVARFNNNVRRIKLIPNPIYSPNYLSLRYTATLVYTYYPYLKTKKVDSYEQGLTSSITTQYVFSDKRMLTSATTTNSKNESIVIANKYPQDFPSDPVLLPMTTLHIINPLIETTTTNSGVQTEQVKTPYQAITVPSSVRYVPQKNQLKIRSNAIEDKQIYNQYDDVGNVTEIQKAGNISQALIWDYYKNNVVAQITNASVADVAYTSFEETGFSSWTSSSSLTMTEAALNALPPTGNKYLILASPVQLRKAVVSGKVYIISYWKDNSTPFSITGATVNTSTVGRTINGWTYHEHKVTATTSTINVSGDGNIDELRLYPLNGQMTTFTYDPLVGVTSKCDPSGVITYYEYDDLGRLSIVRDQNRNVVKKICYNYSGQPENCGLTAVYARAYIEGITYVGRYQYANVVFRFFTDNACTTPVSVSNLFLNVRSTVYYNGSDYYEFKNIGLVVNGNTTTYLTQALLGYDDSDAGFTSLFQIMPGNGYEKSTLSP